MIILHRVKVPLFFIGCSCHSACLDTFPFVYKQSSLRLFHGKRLVAQELSRSLHNDESTTSGSLKIVIRTTDDMLELGAFFSSLVFSNRHKNEQKYANAGRTIFLEGDLGAGKTVFSRGFIRFATGNDDEKITSPTYLLSNTYQTAYSACSRTNNL
jgi:Threonylcarbamoyl adenosine biosynthesis protein TsaE